MKSKSFVTGLLAGVLLLPLIFTGQTPFIGLSRRTGAIVTKGDFIELTAGAAVTAGQALYLDSAGKVQKLTSAQAANFIGIAYNTAVSAATVQVQINGIATATCDGNVAVNDKVGGTSITPAGTLKTLAATQALGSGATTGTVTNGAGTIAVTANGTGATTVIMGTANPTGTSALTSTATTGTVTTLTVSGDTPVSRVAGRALTACTDTGTFSVLLLPQ